MLPELPDPEYTQPSSDEVRAALKRMLEAEPLRDSPQLASFLSFIVEETLGGRGQDLKGYSIATLALGRSENFDPQADPIVRVQAGRLRQAITEYHAANPSDAIAIHLDKGVYLPRFERRLFSQDIVSGPLPASAQIFPPDHSERSRKERAATAINTPQDYSPAKRSMKFWQRSAIACGAALLVTGMAFYLYVRGSQPGGPRSAQTPVDRIVPSMVVEADSTSTDTPELQSVLHRSRDAIARFDDIIVVHDLTDLVSTIVKTGAPKQGHVLTLRIAAMPATEGTQRFSARLIDQADQALLWSREFSPVAGGAAGDAARTRIVQAIATTIAQPYGVIHARLRSGLETGGGAQDPYGCLVASFEYWRSNDSPTHKAVRECLMEAVKTHPRVAGLHAQLAYLHLDEYRQRYNPLPGNPLDRALESAKRAVAVSPASARSHEALLAAHFVRREMESAWRAADRALELNPYDTEIIADVGARYIQTGNFEKGLSMLDEALQLNPAPPAWAVTYRALAFYMLGGLDRSGPTGATLKGTEFPLAIMGLVLVARQYRDEALAKETLARLQSLHPSIAADPKAYLERLNMDDHIIERIIRDFTISRDWAAALP